MQNRIGVIDHSRTLTGRARDRLLREKLNRAIETDRAYSEPPSYCTVQIPEVDGEGNTLDHTFNVGTQTLY